MNWVSFLEEATFSSFQIRPSVKAFHKAFYIGLNQETNYKAGLKQGIDLRVRSKIRYGIVSHGQVINRVGKVAGFDLK